MIRTFLVLTTALVLTGCKARVSQAQTPHPQPSPTAPDSSAATPSGAQTNCHALHQNQPPRIPAGQASIDPCRSSLHVAFNPATRLAWYSAEHLTPAGMSGNLPRREDFVPDPLLPEHLQVETAAYTRSGYDRGHLAPAADFKNDPAGMEASFYTSNVAPQNQTLNREAWSALESATRDCARREGGVYVLTGVAGTRPSRSGRPQAPEAFWKLVSKDGHYRAFIYPNRALTKGHPIREQETDLAGLQARTGLTFSDLNDRQLCGGSFGRSRL